jgi:predicted ABC-type ATPase
MPILSMGEYLRARSRSLSGLRTRAAVSLTELRKAQVYIGPRGGKWADPDHTIPYREDGGEQRTRADEAPKSKPVANQEQEPALTKRQWVASVRAMGLPEDTQKAFKHGDSYTPERAALHEKIKASFLAHVPPVPKDQQPVAVVMMGGSASGKSTVVKHLLGDAGKTDFVNANPDDVKEQLPEYKKGIGEHGGPSAKDTAASVHEESSDIAEEVRNSAIADRKNLILDGTGRNADKYAKKIEQLRAAGYHVRLVMVHVDINGARARAVQRAERSGRWVPDAFVEEAHHVIPGNFEKIAKSADEAVLIDNNGRPPKSVLELQGDQRRVLDESFVKEFEQDAARKHAVARERGWMKALLMSLIKSQSSKLPVSVPMEDMLARLKRTDVGEVEDNATGIEDAEDLKRFREEAAKPEPAPQALHKGLYFGKSGGPFIGPRGGKWADAAHTVPWKDDLAAVRRKSAAKQEHHNEVEAAGFEAGHAYARRLRDEADTSHARHHECQEYDIPKGLKGGDRDTFRVAYNNSYKAAIQLFREQNNALPLRKADRPPAGFAAAPHSHHGGYRRKVNGDWVYWYPGQGVLRPTAAREHFQHASIKVPSPAPAPVRMVEGAPLAPFLHSRADITKNPGLYKMEHGKFRWHAAPGKEGEPGRLEPDVDDRTKAQLVGEYAPLISKEARAALKLHALKATYSLGGGKEGNQTLLDLQRAGVEGLLNAIRAYRGGQPFGMYAQSYVRGYARLEAGRQGRLHLSERHAANLRRYVAAKVRAQAVLGEPSPEQVARFYDLRMKHVHGGLDQAAGDAPVPMEGYDLGVGRKGGEGPQRGAAERRGRLDWARAYDSYLRGDEVELGDAEAAASATQAAPDAEERAAAKEQVGRALAHISGLKGGVEVKARAPGRYESEAAYKVDDAADLLRRRLGLGEHEEAHTTNRLSAEVPVYRKTASGEWKRVSERAARERMDQIVEAAMSRLRDAVRGLRKGYFPELDLLLKSHAAWLPSERAPFVTLGCVS